MDQTNPSEAAAASSPDRLQVSDLPAEHALQAIAQNPNGFFPSTMQAMAVEILRMRKDCPPTAEVEQMRLELASLRQAIGLMTTAKPDMQVDVRDPIGMAQQVVDVVSRLRLRASTACSESGLLAAARDAWKHKADTLGSDLNRIRSLVPTASDEQTTFDAVQAGLQRLRAEAAKVEHPVWRERFMRLRDSIKVQIAWCSTPSGTPHPAMLAEHRVLSCALKNAEAMLCEASGDRASLPSLPAKEGPLPGSFCGTNQPQMPPLQPKVGPATGGVVGASDFLDAMRKTAPKPEADRKMIEGLVEEAVRKVLERRSFTNPGQPFDPSDPIGPKFAPATGQPRTEVPPGSVLVDGRKIPLVEPDGSGTKVVSMTLGNDFHNAMVKADPDFFAGERFLNGETHEQARHRHLHRAMAELAKVVERIGAR